MGIKQMFDDIQERKDKRAEYEQQLVTKSDLNRFRKDVQQQSNRKEAREQVQTSGQKMIKWIAHGFGNVAQSLNNPNDKRRMRISQMPKKLRDMDIVRNATPEKLKSPEMRYRDIRGKLERKRKGR